MVEMIISCLLTPRVLLVKKTLLTEVKAHFRDPQLCLRAFGKRSDSIREPILMTPCTVHHLFCLASQANHSDSQQKTRPSLARDERVRGTTQIFIVVRQFFDDR